MMTLDAICTTAFGVDVNSCKNPDMELLKQARDLIKQVNTGNILFMLCCKYIFFSQTYEESKSNHHVLSTYAILGTGT